MWDIEIWRRDCEEKEATVREVNWADFTELVYYGSPERSSIPRCCLLGLVYFDYIQDMSFLLTSVGRS
jgi:hypothetical protein